MQPDDSHERHLLEALSGLFRPLLRLCIAKGVTLPVLVELLKRVYVETAERDFRLADRPPSDSRVTLLTGVHRKDVRRIRKTPAEEAPTPRGVGLGNQVVSAWLTRPEFLDARGEPRPLARTATAGGGPSFEGLVAGLSKDIRPRAVLDELLRLGVVALEGERVTLYHQALIPDAGLEEQLFFFRRSAGAHLEAAVHNLLGGEPRFFDRIAYRTAVPASRLPEIRAEVEAAATRALKRVFAASKGTAEEGEASLQITFGAFFHAAPNPPGEGP